MQPLAQQRRLWRRATAGLAIAVVVTLAGTAMSFAGGGPFTDVGDTHPFLNEISEVANAGIAAGYPDGSYGGGQPVTRQAMAAFLTRTGSSVVQINGVLPGVSPVTGLGEQTVRNLIAHVPPNDETAEAEQYVLVTGQIDIQDTDSTGCNPCTFAASIDTGAGGTPSSSAEHYFTLSHSNFSDVHDTMTVSQVFRIEGGGNQTFTLQLRGVSASGALNLDIANASVIAQVMPFSAGGLL